MSKSKRMLEIIKDSYEEAKHVQDTLNNRASYHITGISIMLTVIITIGCAALNQTFMIDSELKRRLIIIFCYFITLLLILGLIFTFISLIVEKRHSLPIYKTLSEDMEQFNDDSEVDDNISVLYSDVAESIDKKNKIKAIFLNIVNWLLLATLCLFIVFITICIIL